MTQTFLNKAKFLSTLMVLCLCGVLLVACKTGDKTLFSSGKDKKAEVIATTDKQVTDKTDADKEEIVTNGTGETDDTVVLDKSPITSTGSSANRYMTADGRPHQFVLLAFDGSKSLNMWRESQSFAASTGVRFTYFISGVYFLHPGNANKYTAPRRKPGRSDIGFGVSASDIENRLSQVRRAFKSGHEIASHANGHYDGSKWSDANWAQEFDQFNSLMKNAYKNNGLTDRDPDGWRELLNTIQGFRAPLLGHSSGLWPVLKRKGFRYDTSKTSNWSYWPKKNAQGIWNFPLASIPVDKKSVLSMDYNFYAYHSGAKPDAANAGRYESSMVKAYEGYFNHNYKGNRAPIHIGHHFSKWNNGAYWRAMKTFARNVCGKPEVACVTNAELADFMDGLSAAERKVFQNGSFPKM